MVMEARPALPREHEALAEQICRGFKTLNLPQALTRQCGWARKLYLGGDVDSNISCPEATALLSRTYHCSDSLKNLAVEEWLTILDQVEFLFAPA